MFASPKAMSVASGVLFLLGIIPGMPHFAFLSLALACAFGAIMINRKLVRAQQADDESQRQLALEQAAQVQEPTADLGWDDVSPVDMIGLEVGYRLIPMVDKNQSGELLGRIKGIRKKLSQEAGFLVPAVHIRDNLELQPNGYRILMMGVALGESEIHPDRHLAINPGQVFGTPDGIPGKDPAFGLDAIWIEESVKDHAQSMGYTVVDASTVVATHVNQLLQKNVHELLGHEEVQQMLDRLAKISPKLSESLVPDSVSMATLLKVLKSLLQEQVPIRDFRTIAEALVANSVFDKDPIRLVEAVRTALARAIVQEIYGRESNLPVMTLAVPMEQMLMKSAGQQAGGEMTIEPGLAEQIQRTVSDLAKDQEAKGKPAVLLVAAALRPLLSRLCRFSLSPISVLSYNEIPDDKQITIEATVG
jgi:flagellar biosynthesis protein FlhA